MSDTMTKKVPQIFIYGVVVGSFGLILLAANSPSRKPATVKLDPQELYDNEIADKARCVREVGAKYTAEEIESPRFFMLLRYMRTSDPSTSAEHYVFESSDRYPYRWVVDEGTNYLVKLRDAR